MEDNAIAPGQLDSMVATEAQHGLYAPWLLGFCDNFSPNRPIDSRPGDTWGAGYEQLVPKLIQDLAHVIQAIPRIVLRAYSSVVMRSGVCYTRHPMP